MPTLAKAPVRKAAHSLFIGLQSYTEAQSDIFFGRDDEIDRLTNLVKANTLTIVFGKSGTGKTSLLNAGVFPQLRKDYCLPFRIRLEFGDDSPDLVTQIKNTLRAEIDKYGFNVESYPSTEPLWEYFHKEQLWKSVTPILIFDQFEEIFTLGKKSTQSDTKKLAEFWEELADLIENSIPEKLKQKFLNEKENIGYNYKNQKIKSVFSFREEFLPEFEGVTAKIPSIKYSRFRLLPMNGNQAYEVITKTWKNGINTAQAHKIVGFFTNEEDKNSAYEVMEIEPSLLSQVCSFIDKGRIREHSDKISAEFLDRYPKEIILRSIYDEVLAEGNAAVSPKEKATDGAARPVSEFVEDKLITDEGYRTKYAMSEKDEYIRPGMEVLKSKYFVRDDGKSIELTHDVLAPLIKRDREERRKELALALAKKKANRRALAIIVVSLIAALAFWYFTANKAIQEKNEAIQQKAELDQQIQHAHDSLTSIGDSLRTTQATLDKLKKARADSNHSTKGDTAFYANLLKRSQEDSLHLESLKKQYEGLINQKTELESNIGLQTAQIAEFTISQKRSDSTSTAARRHTTELQRRISRDSTRLFWLQRDYDSLQKKFIAYIRKNPPAAAESGPAEEHHSDTASLKVTLYYSTSKKGGPKVPDNLKIYLIPDNSTNKRIISSAKNYEIHCDEMRLDRAKGRKIAAYVDGAYSFYDVAPGKYFVKICAYYGGFYSYTKKTTGTVSVSWDASPPIR